MGQQLTNLFEKISSRFDRLDWYLFPIGVKRLLPTILINTQEPIVIGCFGMMDGSRDQFKKVNEIITFIENFVVKLSFLSSGGQYCLQSLQYTT